MKQGNKVLLSEIFPLVKKAVPTARVIVVGQHIPESIKKYAGKDIEVRSLSEDYIAGTTKAYAEATVFASPVKGPGGTRLKNLAAMASQLPMVTTSVGISGLGAEPEKDVLVGDADDLGTSQNPLEPRAWPLRVTAWIRLQYSGQKPAASRTARRRGKPRFRRLVGRMRQVRDLPRISAPATRFPADAS